MFDELSKTLNNARPSAEAIKQAHRRQGYPSRRPRTKPVKTLRPAGGGNLLLIAIVVIVLLASPRFLFLIFPICTGYDSPGYGNRAFCALCHVAAVFALNNCNHRSATAMPVAARAAAFVLILLSLGYHLARMFAAVSRLMDSAFA